MVVGLSLPVVDIAAFRADPRSVEGQAFVGALREHLHTTGFVYLTGHGVDPDLERSLLEVSNEFFALPVAERKALAISNSAAFRGYTILGNEQTQGQADWRDQLDYGVEQAAPERADDGPPWRRLRGPNQWPASLPHMQTVALEWMDAMRDVGVDVVRALALGLNQPEDTFTGGFLPHHDLHVKIIRYPVRPDPTAEQGVGLHHDTGVATFILQNEVAGLQVMIGDQMVTAEPLPGSYVLNLGAMMQTATGGYLRATPHRVISPIESPERISVACFFNPTYESTFDPIELPAEFASEADGDVADFAGDTIKTIFGENNLKVRLRSHPDVAANHYADLTEGS